MKEAGQMFSFFYFQRCTVAHGMAVIIPYNFISSLSCVMTAHKIVVTDGFTLNPGDLDWAPLKAFAEVSIYDRTREDQLPERTEEAFVIVTNKTPISAAVIEKAPQLRMIAVTATGYNNVDTDAAGKKGIAVCNVPGYGTDSVAQHTFALILALTNHVGKNAFSVSSGEWTVAKDWCYSKAPIMELKAKVIGIIGYGQIGQRVAAIATSFGMEVLYHNPSLRNGPGTSLPLEEVFRKSDIVTLHCPLTRDNAGFVNATLLSKMKTGSFLVNTSRGQLINEQDLSVALASGPVAGAALDVLSKEPPPVNHPLIGLPHCIITPHNAWLSVEARSRIMETTIENIKQFINGKPQNVVNLILK
jgi:glycerate dehydrogenase